MFPHILCKRHCFDHTVLMCFFPKERVSSHNFLEISQEHEAQWAAAAAEAEAEALAPVEGVEVAPTGADFGFGDFLSDGQDDELPSMYMSEGVHSHISKKKRKMMIKTNIGGPKVEGSGLQGRYSLSLHSKVWQSQARTSSAAADQIVYATIYELFSSLGSL